MSSWTLYYWGWWLSWSPFVGVFIARVSKGRSIREFISGVLLVPALISFLWFSVFGVLGIEMGKNILSYSRCQQKHNSLAYLIIYL